MAPELPVVPTSDQDGGYPRVKLCIAILIIIMSVGYFGYYTFLEADAEFKKMLAMALFGILIGAVGASYGVFDLVGKSKRK